MHVSPVTVGKIAGGAAAVGIAALLFLLFQSDYTLKGTIVVDSGAYPTPARNIDVQLIPGDIEYELQQLRMRYELTLSNAYTDVLKGIYAKCATGMPVQAESEAEGTQKGSGGGISIDSLVAGEVSRAKKEVKEEISRAKKIAKNIKESLQPLTEEEREEMRTRASAYLEYALYCREMAVSDVAGSDFYEWGAQFWEEKAANIKEKGRLIVDEASLNYSTRYLPGGLGNELVQIVSAEVRTNVDVDALLNPQEEEAAEEEKKVEKKEPKKASPAFIAGCPAITSNDITQASSTIVRTQQRAASQLQSDIEQLLLELTLAQTKTDDQGNFVFRGNVIQPGSYYVKARYDTLSADGEPVEYKWFTPVDISMQRFAFNKSTHATLDNTNQGMPPSMDVIPMYREIVFEELVDSVHAYARGETNAAPSKATETKEQ